MRWRSSEVIIILLGLEGVFFAAGAGAAADAFAAEGADFALALTAVCIDADAGLIDAAAGLVDFVVIVTVGALPAGLRDAEEDLSFERLLPAMSFLLGWCAALV